MIINDDEANARCRFIHNRRIDAEEMMFEVTNKNIDIMGILEDACVMTTVEIIGLFQTKLVRRVISNRNDDDSNNGKFHKGEEDNIVVIEKTDIVEIVIPSVDVTTGKEKTVTNHSDILNDVNLGVGNIKSLDETTPSAEELYSVIGDDVEHVVIGGDTTQNSGPNHTGEVSSLITNVEDKNSISKGNVLGIDEVILHNDWMLVEDLVSNVRDFSQSIINDAHDPLENTKERRIKNHGAESVVQPTTIDSWHLEDEFRASRKSIFVMMRKWLASTDTINGRRSRRKNIPRNISHVPINDTSRRMMQGVT
ncbi:hypothetical protein LIER_22183 [Lithospermum erythrorhizon]|uniref:Uncharacterized protein n=1 Tax=Lithospermum erythrorhizon TaxID=34254 RepID=A0AAV3QW08_LITER